MAKFCDKCGAELKNENVKFCDKCGAKVKFTSNTQNNSTTPIMPLNVEQKSMGIALLISFFLNGLGIAYAGNVAKGVGYFVGSIIIIFFLALIFRGWFISLIALIIWIMGLFLTYQEVNEYNLKQRMMIQFYNN